MDSLKIESMLSLIHEENRTLLAYVMAGVIPSRKEYDKAIVETLTKWDTAYDKIMRIDNEKEQSGRDDNS